MGKREMRRDVVLRASSDVKMEHECRGCGNPISQGIKISEVGLGGKWVYYCGKACWDARIELPFEEKLPWQPKPGLGRLKGVLVFLILLLASCGPSGPSVPTQACEVGGLVTVARGLTGSLWGLAIRGPFCNTRISISPVVPDEWLSTIVAHELWHAAGYANRDHGGAACVSHSSLTRKLDVPPCLMELEEMKDVDGVFVIEFVGPGLEDAVEDAVGFWNFWVGRDMFKVAEREE